MLSSSHHLFTTGGVPSLTSLIGGQLVFNIKYYETERGQKPVEEFIDTLGENMQVNLVEARNEAGMTQQ